MKKIWFLVAFSSVFAGPPIWAQTKPVDGSCPTHVTDPQMKKFEDDCVSIAKATAEKKNASFDEDAYRKSAEFKACVEAGVKAAKAVK